MASFYASGPAGAAGGTNPSVGTTGTTAPTSATEIGFIDNSGNLEAVSASNPLPVSATFLGDVSENLAQVNGQPVNVGTGAAGTGTQRVAVSSDSTLASVGSITNALPAGTNIIGKVDIDQTTPGTTNGVVVNSSALPTGAATNAELMTINTTLGTPMQNNGGSVTANIGTTNGLALDSHLTNVQSAPGTPQTAAVTVQGNASGVPVPVSGTITVSSTTANQGTANTVANGWPVRITDGTNVAGVAPASTAAVATQPAEVVALSPNSPLPAGTNTLGKVEVVSQNGAIGIVQPYGSLRATVEGGALFNDAFIGSTLDTTNRWNVPATTGSGTYSVSAGALTLTTGTTASNSIIITSQPTFPIQGLNYIIYGSAIQIEASPVSGVTRFWGRMTYSGTSFSDGVGFQLVGSTLTAVIYQAGTQTFTAALTTPTDGAYHRYSFFKRQDAVFFFLDNLDTPVATASFSPTAVVTPIAFSLVNGGSTLGSAPTYNVISVGISDSGLNNFQFSDGTYQWRKATVKPASTAPVSTDTAIVVGISPNSSLPNPVLPTTPLTGQKTSTGTAVAISSTSQPLVNGVIVQALSTNAGLVYIGGSGVTSSTGFQLQPGQATSTAVANLNEVYVISVSSGDGICFIGS